MPEPAMLDYFYGDEAEQYTFYRIPKVLFTDPSYRRISSDAKILYGLMLDRMGLSVRNGWLDDCNRVFIYFTLEDALEYLCCGHTKAVGLFGELDKHGLIERKKQGQGKPTKIYVKNFVRKAEVLTSEKRKSKVPQTGSQDFRKTATNNTEINKTDLNDKEGQMCSVTIIDATGLPITVEVSHEIYQVFVDYDREIERQRKADSRHRDARSWDTCLIFELSTETLEQTYERIRVLREIDAALEEFTPKQRRRFLLHFAYGYTYLDIAKMEGSNKSTVMRSAKTALKKFKKS